MNSYVTKPNIYTVASIKSIIAVVYNFTDLYIA